MIKDKPGNGMRGWWILILVIVIVAGVVFIILTPWNISSLASHPNPVKSYDEALKRIELLRKQQPADMNPVCQLQFMTHEKKVERTIILVHGYTNCPQQFHELGQRFYDLGYNVLIAPLPYHGLADRLTDAHAKLTAEELAVYADETVDIAQGLGDKVTMMGISAGGVTTAWAAQNRNDIDLAVIISPAFGFLQVPTPLTAAVMNIYMTLPDEFVWWDADLKEKGPSPAYAYPRYSKHALVQILRLGFATQAKAQEMPAAAKKMVVVFNPNDTSVNNALNMDIVKMWQKQGTNVTTYDLKAELNVGHDVIDPTQPYANIEAVYPILIDLVNK
jgi:pimeloyl-ACP methyl ester carboxylesterase